MVGRRVNFGHVTRKVLQITSGIPGVAEANRSAVNDKSVWMDTIKVLQTFTKYVGVILTFMVVQRNPDGTTADPYNLWTALSLVILFLLPSLVDTSLAEDEAAEALRDDVLLGEKMPDAVATVLATSTEHIAFAILYRGLVALTLFSTANTDLVVAWAYLVSIALALMGPFAIICALALSKRFAASKNACAVRAAWKWYKALIYDAGNVALVLALQPAAAAASTTGLVNERFAVVFRVLFFFAISMNGGSLLRQIIIACIDTYLGVNGKETAHSTATVAPELQPQHESLQTDLADARALIKLLSQKIDAMEARASRKADTAATVSVHVENSAT